MEGNPPSFSSSPPGTTTVGNPASFSSSPLGTTTVGAMDLDDLERRSLLLLLLLHILLLLLLLLLRSLSGCSSFISSSPSSSGAWSGGPREKLGVGDKAPLSRGQRSVISSMKASYSPERMKATYSAELIASTRSHIACTRWVLGESGLLGESSWVVIAAHRWAGQTLLADVAIRSLWFGLWLRLPCCS